MTSTEWMAFPPEMQSAMLNFGAGVGPMLNSASHNSQLAIQYAEAASQVEALLGEVRSGGWQGQAAEAFVAAYLPFLAWLIKAAADSMEVADQQEVVAAAYEAAVDAMPTEVELAANQVMRGVLKATNFFGVNTIPIAINEADYVRMWVQAATTMAAYEATSRVALASTPQTSPPPLILKSNGLIHGGEEDSHEDGHNHGGHDHDGHCHGGHASAIDNAFAEILNRVSAGRIVWDPLHGTLNGLDYDDYVFSGNPMWWLARGLEFFQVGEQFWELLFTDPTAAFRFLLYILVFDLPTHIAQLAPWLAETPQLLAVTLGGTSAGLGALAGLAGLPGSSAIPPAVVPALAPVAAVPAMVAVAGAPAVAAPGAPPASAPPGVSGQRHRGRPGAAGYWFRRFPALPRRRRRSRHWVWLRTVGLRQGLGVGLRFRCGRGGCPGLGT
ncbi:hypothetical protein B586_13590 [Mycobacterium haemophilum DSM 44634]|nr:hypothetical protein B586_13590 [Mycobacterium haemophilum DSM 44634]